MPAAGARVQGARETMTIARAADDKEVDPILTLPKAAAAVAGGEAPPETPQAAAAPTPPASAATFEAATSDPLLLLDIPEGSDPAMPAAARSEEKRLNSSH